MKQTISKEEELFKPRRLALSEAEGLVAGFMLWLFLFLLAWPALAANTNSLEGLITGSGAISATSYSSYSGLESMAGNSTGSSYSNYLGYIYCSPIAQTSTAAPVPDTTPPTINSIKFNSITIVSKDYVNADATITATVTDAASAIDASQSSVKVDTASTVFSSLSGDSSYNAATYLLTYKLSSLSSGSHTLTLTAYDTVGNVTFETVSFKTGSGVGINGEVLNYPNPFNPNTQTTQIGYSLTQDTNMDVYLFNVLGQRIWQRSYAAGSEGGRAGYNKVPWDGYSDFGVMASNDIYLCRIVSGGKVIGKCKIVVLK